MYVLGWSFPTKEVEMAKRLTQVAAPQLPEYSFAGSFRQRMVVSTGEGTFDGAKFINVRTGTRVLSGKWQLVLLAGFITDFASKTEERVGDTTLQGFQIIPAFTAEQIQTGLAELGPSSEMRLCCLEAILFPRRYQMFSARMMLQTSGNLNLFLIRDRLARLRAVTMRFGGGFCSIESSDPGELLPTDTRVFRRYRPG